MYMYSKEQRKDSYLSSSYFCSACRGVGVDVSGFLLPVEMATVIEAKVVVIGSQGSSSTQAHSVFEPRSARNCCVCLMLKKNYRRFDRLNHA